jgi:hypothetical protein
MRQGKRSESAGAGRIHRHEHQPNQPPRYTRRTVGKLTHSRKAWAIPKMASGGPCSTCFQYDEAAPAPAAPTAAVAVADDLASNERLSATLKEHRLLHKLLPPISSHRADGRINEDPNHLMIHDDDDDDDDWLCLWRNISRSERGEGTVKLARKQGADSLDLVRRRKRLARATTLITRVTQTLRIVVLRTHVRTLLF